jgi:hypothetical protein
MVANKNTFPSRKGESPSISGNPSNFPDGLQRLIGVMHSRFYIINRITERGEKYNLLSSLPSYDDYSTNYL